MTDDMTVVQAAALVIAMVGEDRSTPDERAAFLVNPLDAANDLSALGLLAIPPLTLAAHVAATYADGALTFQASIARARRLIDAYPVRLDILDAVCAALCGEDTDGVEVEIPPPVPPRETIRAAIVDAVHVRAQNQICLRTGISAKHLSQIMTGKIGVSPAIAVKLEAALGVPAELLATQQALCDVARAREAVTRAASVPAGG